MNKIIVIIDTNTILLLMKGIGFKEAIEEKLDVKPLYYCPESIINELKRISDGKTLLSSQAARALKLIDKVCMITPKKSSDADTDILLNAVEYHDLGYNVLVVTSDRVLRKKLRKAGVPTVYYREKQGRYELEYEPSL